MALLAGSIPPELEYVHLALAPAGLGMGGGGVLDPHVLRGWPEQEGEDFLLVVSSIGSGRKSREY